NVGVHRSFARQLPPHGVAALIDRTAKHQAVGTRKINVFKDAARLRGRRQVEARRYTFRPNDDQFAGFDVAFVGGTDQVKSAGFRGKDNRVFFLTAGSRDATHGQRTKPTRIAGGEDTVAAEHDQRKRAFHAAHSVGDG